MDASICNHGNPTNGGLIAYYTLIIALACKTGSYTRSKMVETAASWVYNARDMALNLL
jgi:hypothetical protein